MKILAVNPGSTSTKIALFQDGQELWNHSQSFSAEELVPYGSVIEQEPLRRRAIEAVLAEKGVDLASLDAVVGRGGLLKPISGGTYQVNDAMIADVTSERYGSHASNLGAPLALALAKRGGCNRAYIVDPVVVDELEDLARISGLPQVPRRSIFHALNQKAMARRYAAETGKAYEDLRLIVVHMGGGISVGAHKGGQIVDVSNGLDGEGPFTPERTGALPLSGVVDLCFSGTYSQAEIHKLIKGKGGLVALLGTNDLREVERRIADGDQEAKLVFNAMAYQVAKEIGAQAAVLQGNVDAIILTGGMAHSQALRDQIAQQVQFIAPVVNYAGENELQALAQGALRVLTGQEEAKVYQG